MICRVQNTCKSTYSDPCLKKTRAACVLYPQCHGQHSVESISFCSPFEYDYLQGSVAVSLRCGGMFNAHYIGKIGK